MTLHHKRPANEIDNQSFLAYHMHVKCIPAPVAHTRSQGFVAVVLPSVLSGESIHQEEEAFLHSGVFVLGRLMDSGMASSPCSTACGGVIPPGLEERGSGG
jgi:hypothetical protein